MRLATIFAFVLTAVACGIPRDGRVKVTGTDSEVGHVPVIDWPACEAFGTKDCGDKLKVWGVVVGIGSDCDWETESGKPSTWTDHEAWERYRYEVGKKQDEAGLNWGIWRIQSSKGWMAPLTPPITYGVVPEGATQESPLDNRPPMLLPSYCSYVVTLLISKGQGINSSVSGGEVKL